MIRRWMRDRSGATAIEYCLIAGIISIAIVSGATGIGQKLFASYFDPVSSGLR